MPDTVLQIDPRDNVLVALSSLTADMTVHYGSSSCPVSENIPVKQKLALVDLHPGDLITMYGMVVGEATQPIARGGLLSTRNIRHRAGGYTAERHPVSFHLPDATAWSSRTFMGYHRADGQVGTRNSWLVLPLVFCENRNVDRLREALEEELGYGSSHNSYRPLVRQMISKQATTSNGQTPESSSPSDRVFPNVDGIRFLTHQGGCGGTRQDAQALCGLLAGYIHHPNVAGATVLSLGCQNAQSSMLMDELRARDPKLTKPVLFFDQQRSGRETVLMSDALEQTFA
jgi:altronate hydrolase